MVHEDFTAETLESLLNAGGEGICGLVARASRWRAGKCQHTSDPQSALEDFHETPFFARFPPCIKERCLYAA
jgi:hypothetical protein